MVVAEIIELQHSHITTHRLDKNMKSSASNERDAVKGNFSLCPNATKVTPVISSRLDTLSGVRMMLGQVVSQPLGVRMKFGTFQVDDYYLTITFDMVVIIGRMRSEK
jgi:hypothetical protein